MEHFEIVIDKQYDGLNPVQFGWATCPPNHSWGPAVRTHWLLHYVVSGFGKFIRKGKTYDVGPGQIFVIPPYLEAYYEADAKHPWHYIWIGFTMTAPLEAFSKPVISCPDAGAIFDEMQSCCNMENGRSAYLSACIWKLASLLLEHSKSKPDYVEKALHCIRSEYASGITVQSIADRLGLNRSYFYTIFTERVGVSPSEYLMNVRLNKAAELMTVYGEKPSKAANSVGYDDLYHFSKIFKKHFGVSPREYCKRAEN